VREVLLEDSYHVATLDNDAPLVFEQSLEFVRRLARDPSRPGAET
jgi:carboxylesterase